VSVTYKPVEGYPGYRVGDDGSVWCCIRRNGKQVFLTDDWRPAVTYMQNGYTIARIWRHHKERKVRVHRLVLMTFVGPCPPGMEACHFPNPERSDNRLSNLRWDTRSNNGRDRLRVFREAGLKPCSKCKSVKTLTEFPLHSASADGRNSHCKPCAAERIRAYKRRLREGAA
jgi:hypothetical protein